MTHAAPSIQAFSEFFSSTLLKDDCIWTIWTIEELTTSKCTHFF